MRGLVMALLCAGAILAIGIAPAGFAEAKSSSWFDMENCQMCAPMVAEKGLMEHTHWDNHSFATGMMMVTTVDAGFEEAYKRASGKMAELGQKLAKGEKMNLCGHCLSINDLMKGGAKMDQVQTTAGSVMLVSSGDPALIAKIHAHADRTNAEMKQMMEHQGHQH